MFTTPLLNLSLDRDIVLTDTFKPQRYERRVSILRTGSMYVTLRGSYTYGQVVEITALPAEGTYFHQWQGVQETRLLTQAGLLTETLKLTESQASQKVTIIGST